MTSLGSGVSPQGQPVPGGLDLTTPDLRRQPGDPTLDRPPEKMRLPGQLSFDEQPLLYAMVNAFREVAVEMANFKARLAVLEAR